jgi:hypothetical protein
VLATLMRAAGQPLPLTVRCALLYPCTPRGE